MLSTATSHVFVHRDPKSPPPPGPSSTRFVCLSDTHSRSFDIPPGDILLHAGDLSSWGNLLQLEKTIDWLASLPHPVKIIIAGNHDLCLDRSYAGKFDTKNLVRGPLAQKAGIYYLEHESVEITLQGHRWKVYGSPAAPRYSHGAFQYETAVEAREIYERIPADTDILLTHTPPYQIHDLTRGGKHAGCRILADRLQQLELSSAKPEIASLASLDGVSDVISIPGQPGDQEEVQMASSHCRLHVWGHIHEAYGASIHSGPNGERVQVNAALAWFGEPVVVDLHHG